MKLFQPLAALSALSWTLTEALTAAKRGIAEPSTYGMLMFSFDAATAGVDGSVIIRYDDMKFSGVTISAELDFSKVDMDALAKADGNCTADSVTEYTLSLHNMWSQPADAPATSRTFAMCSKNMAGNQYDPYKACGPESEYVDTPACAGRTEEYNCTPEEYKTNFAACGAGDLSGKLGNLTPDEQGKVSVQLHDQRFPFWDEYKPSWNLGIQAVCGESTPRLSCALGYQAMVGKKMLKTAAVKKMVNDMAKNDGEIVLGNSVHVKIHAAHHKK